MEYTETCSTCKFYISYFEIYDFDPDEPDDMGECKVEGLYRPSSEKCGISATDWCPEWSPVDE